MADESRKYVLPAEYSTEVYRTESDRIAIAQEDPMDTDPSVVVVSVERVDRLIAMLQAVRDEIIADRATSEDPQFR